jgi:small subunit ribosomal protein S2
MVTKEKTLKKTTTRSAKTTAKTKAKSKAAVKVTPVKDQGSLLEGLMKAGCHFGHSISKVNPRMQDYIFTIKDRVHIFDLIKTKKQLEEASAFLAKEVADGGKIIFVGTKRQAIEGVETIAKKTGMYYINTRWVGGLLTNWSEVKKNLDRLAELDKKLVKKDLPLTKYEISVLRKEQRRLQSLYGGLVGLEELPKAVFIIDSKKEQTAIREAGIMKIAVVGILDTNADPRGVDYVIPANDDAKASVDYILDQISLAINRK